MVGDVSAPIRVLLWMTPGLQRAILNAALAKEQDMIVFIDTPEPELHGPENAAALGKAIHRWHPDVLILPAASAAITQMVGDVGCTAAVFVSTDSRTALSYLGDVSPDALVSMVRSVASHASYG